MDFTQKLLETCPDLIYVFDLDQRLSIYRNRKLHETLGYSDDELEYSLAVIPQQLMHPEDAQDIAVLMARLKALGPGQVDKLEFRMREKGGRWRHYCSRVTPLAQNPRGETSQILGMISDVSAKKWAEAAAEEAVMQAERASEAKSQFLAQMSHEIRTPLAGIIGAASLLQTTTMTEEQRDHVETIGRTADALQGIVDDVLDYSKIEAGKLDLNAAPFRLVELVEDSLKAVEGRAAAKGLALYVSFQHALPGELIGDAQRIRQILMNYLANAVKFTRHGEVRLDVTQIERHGPRCRVRFAVIDTGIGIAPQAQPLIFRKYTQAEAAVAGCYGGTGLGLAISKELAELMGGRVAFTSHAGEGSTFSLELELEVAEAVPSARAFAGYQWEGLKVALMSDHAGSGEALRSLCAGGGARVELALALNGELPALDLASFDVLIVDCQRRGSLLGRAATLERFAAVPGRKILVTPLDSTFSAKVATAREHGFVACLPQPASLRRIASLLATGQDQPVKTEREAEPALDGPHSILIVDDNPDNRAILAKMVERSGCDYRFATTGREAVEAVREARPSLVFMDCQMPEMDGYAATRAIRALPEGEGLPILGLTANVLGSRRADCLKAGMDEVLSKPVRLQEIKRQMARWLAKPIAKEA